MKWVFGIGGLVGGGAAVFLLFHLGVMDFANNVPGVEQEPNFTLPTYLSFIGVMLTAVTVVLAAVAIGIGVVAAFTVRELKESANETVSEAKTIASEAKAEAEAGRIEALKQVEEALSKEAFDERVGAYIKEQQRKSVAELEEEFDPEDSGDR